MKYIAILVVLILICFSLAVIKATTKHRTIVFKNGLVVNSFDNNGYVTYICTQSGYGMKASFVVNGSVVSPIEIMRSLSALSAVCGQDIEKEQNYSMGEWTFTKSKNGDVDWFGCELTKNISIRYDGVDIKWDDKIDDVILRLGASGSEVRKDTHNILWNYYFQ